MTKRARLPLVGPVGVASVQEGVWVADGPSKSATLFDAASLETRARIVVPDKPRAIAATKDIVAIALEDGQLLTFGADFNPRWRADLDSRDVQLKASRERVWSWNRDASCFLTWEADGTPLRLDGVGATSFSPVDSGVYWLSADGFAVFSARDKEPSRAQLPSDVLPAGALIACANSLWLSIGGGLLLADARTLRPRARIGAPDGPVPHLACHDGRLFGGGRRGVFSLEPAADDNARSLGVAPKGELLAVVVSGTHLWAVERDEPTVHVVSIP